MIIPYYKCRLKLVPEDSVRRETQTLIILIRRKGCVGCYVTKALIKCVKAPATQYIKCLHSIIYYAVQQSPVSRMP